MRRGMDRNEISWTLNPRSSVQLRGLPPSSLGIECWAFDVGRSLALVLWLLNELQNELQNKNWERNFEDFVDGNPAGAL